MGPQQWRVWVAVHDGCETTGAISRRVHEPVSKIGRAISNLITRGCLERTGTVARRTYHSMYAPPPKPVKEPSIHIQAMTKRRCMNQSCRAPFSTSEDYRMCSLHRRWATEHRWGQG